VAPMKKGYAPVDMTEKLGQWERDNHVASAGSYFVHMGLAHYYFGEYEEAQDYLEEVRRYLTGLTDNVLKRQWHIFLVLNLLKLYEKAIKAARNREQQAEGQSHEGGPEGVNGLEVPRRRVRNWQGKAEFSLTTVMTRILADGYRMPLGQLMAQIQPLINQVETWASLGPLLKPYLALLHAELERVTGEFKVARSLYLDALNAAHEQRYTFLEGYVSECLGELLRQAGQGSARMYLVEAVRLYRKCHAERKEISLVERYPEYFEEEKAAISQYQATSADATLPDLDVDYLMKSSLAISAEIELDSLLKKIMTVVIECSGAQHGYLLIEDAGNLLVRAESHIGGNQAARTLDQKLDDANDICKAIVRYVYRTGERVILNNALQEGLFKDNAEVQSMPLRSVLCLPVIKQSRRIGILYLENRLSDSVFTAEKTQMTELLTSQAAISLENARLMEETRRADEQIKKSLREKEVLLKEIHHRVKNNLEIIQSMLSLQLPYVRGEHAMEPFKESQNRIYSMALIHEKLYESESLAEIDVAEYMRSLADNLFFSYGVDDGDIKLNMHVDDVAIDVNKLIPCALIVNELVSNSLKHAFPDSRRRNGVREIGITLTRDGADTLVLTVGDNGVGLPPGFEIQDSESLGLKLVSVLVRQLKGTLHVAGNEGAKFTVAFEGSK